MKISIITICYNSEKTLETTLKSVINQTYKDIEYIIVDGGSNDKTLDLIQKYKANISNWVSEPDKGLYDALNKGVKLAKGAVIGFLHSDDVFASNNTIAQIAEVFKKNKTDGTYGDLVYTSGKNAENILRFWKSKPFNRKLLKQGWMPAHPTLFLTKRVYQETGNFNINYKIAADYDFMIRVLKNENYSFVYMPQIITKMRVGGASNKSISNIIKKSKEDFKAIKTNKIGGLLTLFLKNSSKITQFFKKINS